MKRVALVVFTAVFASGCVQNAFDAWCTNHPDLCHPQDAGLDDADAGLDAGFDAGPGPDAGTPDAGTHDAGPEGLVLDRSAWNFGPVLVGGASVALEVTVTNLGPGDEGPLALTAEADGGAPFLAGGPCAGATLAPGRSCRLTVVFSPTEPGELTAALLVSGPQRSARVTVTGTGLAMSAVTAAPPRWDFGAARVGTSSTPLQLTFKNTGTTALAPVTAGLVGDGFELLVNGCALPSLPAGASCAAQVRFSPGLAGAHLASLHFDVAGVVTAAASLGGLGVEGGALTLTPVTSADFGDVSPNGTVLRDFTVANTGTASTGPLATRLTGMSTDLLSLQNDLCAGRVLQPGDACTVRVAVTASQPGPLSASLSVRATPGGGAVQALSGVALAPPTLVFSPPQALFGAVGLGQSAPLGFTLHNQGGVTATLVALSLAGTDASVFSLSHGCPATLGAGASCSGTVTFSPTTPGPRAARVRAQGALDVTPDSLALDGTGLPAGALGFAPPSLSFAHVLQGSASAPQTFTIANDGGSPSSPLAVSLEGNSPGDFSVDGGCLGATLASGASCTLAVAFTPASSARGPLSASVRVSGGTAGEAAATVSGIADAPAALTATNTLAFSGVGQGDTALRSLTVHNAGDLAAGAVTFGLSGADAALFSVVVNGCASGVGAGSDCVVQVQFAPATSTPGPRSALLTLTSPGSTVDVTLGGTTLARAHLTSGVAAHDFTTLTVNASADFDFTVLNDGEVQTPAGLVTSVVGAPSAFSVVAAGTTCPASAPLAPNAPCVVRVRYRPTTTGAHADTVRVDSGALRLDLAVTGAGALGSLQLTPSPVVFGDAIFGGADTDATLTVKNVGAGSTGTLSAMSSSADFVVLASGTCGPALAPNAECTFALRFHPAATGPRSGTLTVSDTTGPGSSASLEATALRQATLASSTPALDFDVVGANTMNATLSWVVRNDGDVATGPPSVSGLALPFTSTGCTTALSPSASCTLSLRFAPTALGTFTSTAVLSATPGGTVQVDLTGRGGNTLTVTRVGTGTVTDDSGRLVCGPGCASATVAYLPTATPTLTARTTNGSGFVFTGWTGNPCEAGGPSVTCSAVPLTSSVSLTATFTEALVDKGLAFVSAGTVSVSSGVAALDALCNAEASSAGINTATHDAFKALAITSSASRNVIGPPFVPAGGLMGVDGKPFLEVLSAGSPLVLYPLRHTATGRDEPNVPIATGAGSSGNCTDWGSTAGFARRGLTGAGSDYWFLKDIVACSGPGQRVACFAPALNPAPWASPLPTPMGVKRFWAVPFYVGLMTPTQACAAQLPPGVSASSAFVPMNGSGAPALSATSLYVRPDGVVLGTGAQLTSASALRAGPWVACSSSGCLPMQGRDRVFTATATPTTPGVSTDTCGNWTVGGTTLGGSPTLPDAHWWSDGALGCGGGSFQTHVYCVEP